MTRNRSRMRDWSRTGWALTLIAVALYVAAPIAHEVVHPDWRVQALAGAQHEAPPSKKHGPQSDECVLGQALVGIGHALASVSAKLVPPRALIAVAHWTYAAPAQGVTLYTPRSRGPPALPA